MQQLNEKPILSAQHVAQITQLIAAHQNTSKTGKLNNKKARGPDSYPYTLVCFNDEYYRKEPHPNREKITGSMEAKFSLSTVKFKLIQGQLCWESTNKFFKSMKPLRERFSLSQIIESCLETQRSYPNSLFQILGNKVLLMMDNLPGEELASLIDSEEFAQLDLAQRHELVWQLYKYVRYLQLHSIVHSDLKLENILVRLKPLSLFLIDFDFAIPAVKSACSRGTLLYLAPEIFNGGFNSLASDVYAFGLILYFIYGGQSVLDDFSIRVPDDSENHEKGLPYDQIRNFVNFLTLEFNIDYIKKMLPSLPNLLHELISGLCQVNPRIRLDVMRHFEKIFAIISGGIPLELLVREQVKLPEASKNSLPSLQILNGSQQEFSGFKRHGLFTQFSAKNSAFKERNKKRSIEDKPVVSNKIRGTEYSFPSRSVQTVHSLPHVSLSQ